jgi:hypothetical protein
MRRYFLLLAMAMTVNLSWDQSVTPGIEFNTIRCGTKSGGPYNALVVKSKSPIVSFKRSGVPRGTYFCVITATGKTGESGPSNEIKVVP